MTDYSFPYDIKFVENGINDKLDKKFAIKKHLAFDSIKKTINIDILNKTKSRFSQIQHIQ